MELQIGDGHEYEAVLRSFATDDETLFFTAEWNGACRGNPESVPFCFKDAESVDLLIDTLTRLRTEAFGEREKPKPKNSLDIAVKVRLDTTELEQALTRLTG